MRTSCPSAAPLSISSQSESESESESEFIIASCMAFAWHFLAFFLYLAAVSGVAVFAFFLNFLACLTSFFTWSPESESKSESESAGGE